MHPRGERLYCAQAAWTTQCSSNTKTCPFHGDKADFQLVYVGFRGGVLVTLLCAVTLMSSTSGRGTTSPWPPQQCPKTRGRGPNWEGRSEESGSQGPCGLSMCPHGGKRCGGMGKAGLWGDSVTAPERAPHLSILGQAPQPPQAHFTIHTPS